LTIAIDQPNRRYTNVSFWYKKSGGRWSLTSLQLVLEGATMKLLTKFNLILLVLFGTCGLIISQIAYAFSSRTPAEKFSRKQS
jgi:hypothetical protein